MNKSLKLDLNFLKALLKRLTPIAKKHGSFAVLMLVLIAYLFVVWRISTLASAEPSDAEVNAATTSSAVPTINKDAIQKIESLEQNSAQVHSLFNQARNNPFSE